MNAIDQSKKGDQGSVYGSTDMIKCAHPDCKEVFKKAPNKVYHSLDCKNDYHRLEITAGKKALTRGKIHASLLDNSPRLQRVAKFLKDGKPHSTREIIIGADVCAVNTIIGELRDSKNGFDIVCKRRGDIYEYTMIGGQSQLLRIV